MVKTPRRFVVYGDFEGNTLGSLFGGAFQSYRQKLGRQAGSAVGGRYAETDNLALVSGRPAENESSWDEAVTANEAEGAGRVHEIGDGVAIPCLVKTSAVKSRNDFGMGYGARNGVMGHHGRPPFFAGMAAGGRKYKGDGDASVCSGRQRRAAIVATTAASGRAGAELRAVSMPASVSLCATSPAASRTPR